MTAAVLGAFMVQVAFAQPPAQNKVWKEGEYPMFEAATKEAQPGKRLDLIDAWKQKFPASDYEDIRQQAYLQTYSGAMAAAYASQDAQVLALGSKSANAVLSNWDTLIANKPAEMSDADWAAAKKQVRTMAQNMSGYVALQQKDYLKAEAELIKCLNQDPNQGGVSFWLFLAAASQRVPAKVPLAYFSLARSAMYDGEGALDAANRQKNKADFESRYVKYHGATDGMVEVENLAKTQALPPPDFKLLSKQEIADILTKVKEKEEEEFRKNNPMLALWVRIKTALIAPEGAAYFEDKMKGAGLPGGVGGVTEFKGKLIEAKPALRPKELVLSVEDGKTADVTLKLDTPLIGKMEPGAEIGFQGIATAYTASPYMVTFDVEKAKVTGWKAAPPARPGPRRPAR
jgi:hypothetical protein